MKKIRKGALCCILLLTIIISSIPMNKELSRRHQIRILVCEEWIYQA